MRRGLRPAPFANTPLSIWVRATSPCVGRVSPPPTASCRCPPWIVSLVAQILGDHEGSRLFWSLVETGLAEQADASFDPHDGVGEMSVHWVCEPEANDEVESIIRREFARFAESLDEEDLLRSRAKVATAVTLAGESPSGRMHRLGANWTVGREYSTLEEELARIEAVTLDGLREYLEAFPLEARMTGRLLPEG